MAVSFGQSSKGRCRRRCENEGRQRRDKGETSEGRQPVAACHHHHRDEPYIEEDRKHAQIVPCRRQQYPHAHRIQRQPGKGAGRTRHRHHRDHRRHHGGGGSADPRDSGRHLRGRGYGRRRLYDGHLWPEDGAIPGCILQRVLDGDELRPDPGRPVRVEQSLDRPAAEGGRGDSAGLARPCGNEQDEPWTCSKPPPRKPAPSGPSRPPCRLRGYRWRA